MTGAMTYDEIMFAQDPVTDNFFVELHLAEKRMSFHEAGHAVVGYSLGFGCAFVTIDPNHPEVLKLTAGGLYAPERSVANCLEVGSKILAGPCAQFVACKKKWLAMRE